jgi:osmotically inducible lipoprotein OsmB
MKKIAYPLLAIAMASTVACTNMSKEEQGTMTGAGIGAVAGAGIAALSGGSGWTGAAIGAVVGGIVGDIKGKDKVANN